jgi:hypothetical protein
MMRVDAVIPGSKIDWQGNPAWCLGKCPTYLQEEILIGWKPEDNTRNGWLKSDLSDPGEMEAYHILDKAGCVRGYWLSYGTEVTLIVAARLPSKSPGMSCRLCRDFSPFAEANRPDGTSFICFPCRQGWIPSGY